jgi:hypothetical protein
LAACSGNNCITYTKYTSDSERSTLSLIRKEEWYLGHTVSPEGVTTNPEKLKAIQEWLTLRNKHDIKSFLGLCTYYRWFISSFADIAKPLTRLTEEKQAFQCPPEVEAMLQSLKEALCTTPSLVTSNQDRSPSLTHTHN